MHNHHYSITFIKTKYGYLTYNGFSDNINDKNLILLPSNSYGVWSSNKIRLDFFLKEFKGSLEDRNKLQECINDLELKSFYCVKKGTCCCYQNDCIYKNNCDFWNKDRETLKIDKIYS